MARQRAAERVSRAAVRAALQEAASVTGLLITTDTMVGELPKKEAACHARGGGIVA
jgi:chaperonin GroEL